MTLPDIFISYRRDDTTGSAGRLYDSLQHDFGRDHVFIDVDTLQPGDDFIDAIRQRLIGCEVMLVVIGRRWLTAANEDGTRRLDDAGDYLRVELQTALDRRIRVIPVLVERATMPRQEDLPEPLRLLARRQAVELRETRWADDVAMLVETIRHLTPAAAATASDASATDTPAGRSPAATIGGPQPAGDGVMGVKTPARRRTLVWTAGATLTAIVLIARGVSYYQSSALPERQSPPTGAAATDLQKACAAGAASSCASLGLMYQNGQGVTKDDARAAAFYQKACDGGDAAGCSSLGLMYDSGRGVTKDDARAVALYRKACEAGSMRGCSRLGTAYEYGEGTANDDVQAVAHYQQACDGGDSLGCGNLGLMYAKGRGVAKDDAQAVTLFRKACGDGVPQGCNSLGIMYESGRAVARDEGQAVAFFQKACDGKDPLGCSNLQRLQRR